MNMPPATPPATAPSRAAAPPPNSLVPEHGWHCGHYFYRFRDRRMFSSAGQAELIAALQPPVEQRPERLQGYIVTGHKADFGVMVMDPDPLKVNSIHQAILSGSLGEVIEPTWSFISVSEISEYVPTEEQFRQNLIAEGLAPNSPELEARAKAYVDRLPIMNHQRLSPEFPEWPAACFYPMNKSRVVGANWFTTPFSHRRELMAEHARSGIAFAGRVSQVITVGVGLDDWEWMVTLWARNPQYLKDIVYRMRFDEASAAYAEFGPFYTGYRATAEEILQHCRLIPPRTTS